MTEKEGKNSTADFLYRGGQNFSKKNNKDNFFPKSLKSFLALSYLAHSSGHPWAIVKSLMSPILNFLPVSDMQRN
jgi:hypothetical protein